MRKWKAIAASVAGTRHTAIGGECEDAFAYKFIETSVGEVLVAAVSDGAGSASRSAEGARIACTQFLIEVEELLTRPGGAAAFSERELWAAWECTRATLVDHAETEGINLKELACTLLTAVVFSDSALIGQVGDGAVVLCHDGQCAVPIWPATGEFINETFFLTDESWPRHWNTEVTPVRIDAICMFTDGLQNLILDMRGRTAEPRFVTPVVRGLDSVSATQLQDDLVRFLRSERVISRTDDDLTLFVAARTVE